MNTHLLIQSSKEDICYCSKCGKLSYKGKIGQNLPFKCLNTFNIDPLKIKYRPITAIANYNLSNHIKYLECKNKGISKIKSLTNNFGLKSMILYKAINFMNQIYLDNEVSLEYIDIIASLCVLLVIDYNERCIPSIIEEYLTKDQRDILYGFCYENDDKDINNGLIPFNDKNEKIKHTSNLNGLLRYIKKNVNNFRYWEIMCLKYLNYDLGKYTAYDYLILFFELGIFFCEENVDIIDKLKYCVKILDYIILNKCSCDFSQYTFAMSIIKIVLENDNFFDKKVFKYIYGVDLSKKKYINCSNLIKNILNLAVKIDSIKSLNYMINFNKINNGNQIYLNKFINSNGKNIIMDNHFLLNGNINQSNKIKKGKKSFKSNKEKDKIEENNKLENNNFFIYNNKNINFDGLNHNLINNNSIIINNNFINNNININNNNFNFKKLYNNNCNNNIFEKNIDINNDNFFYFSINDKIINKCNNKNNNFQ
jgi:hypothetical protein